MPNPPEKTFLQRIFEGTDVPVVAINSYGEILYTNSHFDDRCGPTDPGSKCWDVIEGHDAYGNRYCCSGCPLLVMRRAGESIRPFQLRIGRDEEAILYWMIPLDVTMEERVHVYALVPNEPLSVHVPVRKASALPQPKDIAQRVFDLEPSPPLQSTDPQSTLTDRETQILALLCTGYGTQRIAKELFISPSTVRNHVQRVLKKLGACSRLEAVAIARERDLL